MYHHRLGYPLLLLFRTRRFSQMMGSMFVSRYSRFLIPLLAQAYNIRLETYVVPKDGFQSVNAFFIRASHPEFRQFAHENEVLGSPVDGCLEVFPDIMSTQDFCVKGYSANLEKLFWPSVVDFFGGDLLFCRLRFSDYHRFHFFDDGQVLSSVSRAWPLYSVDASVLDTGFWTENKSHCMTLQAQQFGRVLCLEVGATNVWSILNHKNAWATFIRGEEKGYFQLGGSAVLLVFEKGKIQWSEKLLQANKRGEEYEVMTGQEIGKCL